MRQSENYLKYFQIIIIIILIIIFCLLLFLNINYHKKSKIYPKLNLESVNINYSLVGNQPDSKIPSYQIKDDIIYE